MKPHTAENDADSLSSCQLQQLSPILCLPAELRCVVYAYALTFTHTLRLQDSATVQKHFPTGPTIQREAAKTHNTIIYRKQPWLSDNSCTALLLTNRTIHNEALSIFYSANTFHFPALLAGLTPSTAKIPCIELIQHASIDFSYTLTHLWGVKDIDELDSTLAACIQQLLNSCPALQSLTLHIPSNFVLFLLVSLARNAHSATVYVLSSLQSHLARLSIVGRVDYRSLTGIEPTSPFTPMGLCTMIAPREEWVAETHVEEADCQVENCYEIAHSRNVAEGLVTSSTKARWGFRWERARVGGG